MSYDPIHQITTAGHPPVHRPTDARAGMQPCEIPPGVEVVTLPNGVRTLAYIDSTPPSAPPSTTGSAAQPIPRWAKTTALLAPTVGGGTAAAGIGLSHAAPGLIAMSQALWSGAALIGISGLSAAVLAWAARHRSTNAHAAPTQITQNITATGLFGRANGTINH